MVEKSVSPAQPCGCGPHSPGSGETDLASSKKSAGGREPSQRAPSRPVRWVLVISCLSVQTISFDSTFTQLRISR